MQMMTAANWVHRVELEATAWSDADAAKSIILVLPLSTGPSWHHRAIAFGPDVLAILIVYKHNFDDVESTRQFAARTFRSSILMLRRGINS